MAVQITAVSDLCSTCEDLVDVNGEHIPRTAFAALDSDDHAFFGIEPGIHIPELTPDIAQKCLEPMPEDEIYPLFPEGAGLTVAPDDVSGKYVKRPAWSDYLDFRGGDFLARLLLEEAKTMEFLTQHFHPNIVRYYGCRVKRGRITGLVIDSLGNDLMSAETQPGLFKGKVNKARILKGLRSALDHLHDLGMAHNDVNPSNIMLGEGGEPILIDFGSCQPFGKPLMSGGTAGWLREQATTSDQAHDEEGLERMPSWLDKIISKIEASS